MNQEQPQRFVAKAGHEIFDSHAQNIVSILSSPRIQAYLTPEQRRAVASLGTKDGSLKYADFCRIPPATKRELFGEHSPFLQPNFWDTPRQLIAAAGTSRDLLAFRARDFAAERSQFETLASLVSGLFSLDARKAFLLNAYPVGIYVPEGYNSMDAGAKPEVIASALSSIAPHFDDVILFCQPTLLRYLATQKMLPEAILNRLRCIIGGTWIPSTFFEALASPTHDASFFQSRTLALYGIAEVGLGIGFCTPELSATRANTTAFSQFAWGAQPFYIAADRYLVEVVDGQVLVTTLANNCATPLVRYATGDQATLFFDTAAKRYGLMLTTRPPPKPVPVTDMQVETVFCACDVWDELTGNYAIDEEGLLVEAYPFLRNGTRPRGRWRASLPRELQVTYTSAIVRREGHIWNDLLRKPSPYSPVLRAPSHPDHLGAEQLKPG